MTEFAWQLKSPIIPQDMRMLKQLLLHNREITDELHFFQTPDPLEIDPVSLGIEQKQIEIMCMSLLKAHRQKTKIAIFGDYDADGICATSILWRLLFDAGFEVVPFVPNRLEHGYGLSLKAAQALISKEHPEIIVTVDNGIVAHEAVSWLGTQKIKVIITDHHQPEKDKQGQITVPKAEAVILSTKLCGASVAWVVGKLILESLPQNSIENIKEKLVQELDLCALATIADQVPLLGFNRSFARFGLGKLKETSRPGLLALFAQAGISPETIKESSVGYSLAPRINALGRLAEGIAGVRLLCTKNSTKAHSLAENLNDLNIERQDITQVALEEAENQVVGQKNQAILIVFSPDFHEGVIGLVAGRLCEKYFKPVLVLGGTGEVIKGSARSVVGVNITDFIRQLKDDLLDVGGHPLAAGLTLKKANLKLFTEKLQTLAQKKIDKNLLVPKIEADCQLPTQLVSLEVAQALQAFAPFGQTNPEPIFVLNNYEVLACQTIGKESRHLKLLLKSQANSTEQNPKPLTALFWRNGHKSADFKVGTKIDLVVKLEINTWRQRESLQLIILQINTYLNANPPAHGFVAVS